MRWNIDPSHSAVELSVRHLMITNVKGRFGKLSGTVELDTEHPERSQIDVTIDATSIDTRDDKRDAHLRSPDFFDVEQFPTIEFVSKRVEARDDSFALTGDLTVHGVTREVTWNLDYDGSVQDPWGGTRAGFSATIDVNRKDWGLEWNVALEAGGFVVSDKVKLNVEIEAIKQ